MSSPHRSPRRRVGHAVLFLACGAVTTVLVAWTCAAATTLQILNGRQFHTAPQATASGAVPSWPVPVPREWRPPLIEQRSAARGVRWQAAATGWGDPHQAVEVYRAGWPLPALRWTQWHESDSRGNASARASGAGPVIRLPSPVGTRGVASNWGWVAGWVPRQLPLIPEWPGFAVNAAAYAATLWGLSRALGACARRAVLVRRSRLGQCPGCGYARAGLMDSAACPECGSCDARASIGAGTHSARSG